MKSCIHTFDTGTQNLRAYLDSTEDEATLTKQLSQRPEILTAAEGALVAKIMAAHVGRKQYIYAVAIVSLYGLLERFVDSLIESYVLRLATLVSNYGGLPKAIIDRHIAYSMELVKAIQEDRHRGSLSAADVVENLHLCLSGAVPFRVNGAAFALHRGNLYLDKITRFLSDVGIDTHLRRVSIQRALLEYFEDQYYGRDIRGVADQDLAALFEPIESLVDRRNEISHGVINVGDIESVDLLKTRCRFLQAYARSLYGVVVQEVLKFQIPFQGIKSLGQPILVHGHSIVCLKLIDTRVAVGDFMVAATNDTMEPYRYGKIESLEIKNTRVSDVVATDAPVEIGAKVPFKAANHFEYFVFADETI